MRSLFLVGAGAVLGATGPAVAQEAPAWHPIPGHLMTRWASDVSPEKAWPEYPRPQMVRERWLNLNGLWSYAITPIGAASFEKAEGEILVPFAPESSLSGVGRVLQPTEKLWYRRTFRIPADWGNSRIILNFGAIDWATGVLVNGKPCGRHEGGYDPFFFDITRALKEGENEIVVAVTDATGAGGEPRGKQSLRPESIWYTSTSGIWQTVWLEPVPAAAWVRSQRITPDVARSALTVDVDWMRPGEATDLDEVQISLEVLEGGRPVARGVPGASIAIPTPRLWSPDHPFLYELRTRVTTRAGADEVRSYFGMREIKVASDDRGTPRIMLNGRPIFQFGPLDQGFWPDGLYTPPTDEAMKFDIEAVKGMGGNMLRKHVKVEPDRFYAWCDRLGVLVWQDMPSPFPPKSADGHWKDGYLRELEAMIRTHINHPSIVMWVPFNEGWGQHDTEDVVRRVREWDPTRLIDNASGWTDAGVGDVLDVHVYPGPGMSRSHSSRAQVLGEFGGLGLPLERHTWVQKNNWGYVSFHDQNELTEAYVGLVARIPPLVARGLCAAVYTQTTDVEIECNGWLTYDRAVWKVDPARAAPVASLLYAPPGELRTLAPAAPEQRSTWRYTTEHPPEGWERPDFDDSAWRSGPGGFGTQGTPGATVGTRWETADIWIRRTFELGDGVHQPYLDLHHDEDAEVYVNGVRAASLAGFATEYTFEPLSPEASAALRKGTNTLAAHCHQTRGGQYLDAGLIDLVPAGPAPAK